MSLSQITQSPLIFIIDDDQDICELAQSELQCYGYDVRTFSTGNQAWLALKQIKPAVCIVDLGLPDMDGMKLVKELSETPDIGVLILSGRGSLPDQILGLELGGDDYITKPFEPRNLVARINSLVRRLNRPTESQPQLKTIRTAKFADWTYTPTTLTLRHSSGKSYALSTAEGDLLNTLIGSQKQILSRDRLLGEQAIPYDRSIDSRMSRLRKKIEENPKQPQIIKTVYGAGYIFAVDVSWEEVDC